MSGEPSDGERIEIALALPVRDGRTLVSLRPEGSHLAGYWEFPGGKAAAGESPDDAAKRELAEETGLVATALEPLAIFVHEYPARPLRFHVFLARDPSGEPHPRWLWKTLPELRELRMPPANEQILAALAWRL